MSELMTPQSMLAMPVPALATLSSADLQRLKTNATDLLALAKALSEHLDRALHAKYAARAKQLRDADGKDTGVVHFDDGGLRISAELPKKVEWNQDELIKIAKRITKEGDDPSEYIDVKYSVAETKFNAWPEAIRAQFAPARTLKTGKPTYVLRSHDEPARGENGGAA